MAKELPKSIGPYVLGDIIGDGGMAIVRVASLAGRPALKTRLGRGVHLIDRIAVKMSKHELAVQAVLRDEVTLGCGLRHPNVVRIRKLHTYGDRAIVEMEYLEGVTVGKVVERQKRSCMPMPWLAATEITRQAALGLHALHTHRNRYGRPFNAVHRDIKPHNLMLSPGGRVKLFDFGIACFKGRACLDEPGAVIGTPPYMSPELVHRSGVDHRSDVFALGTTLHELLTNDRAFSRSDMYETLMAVTEGGPEPELRRVRKKWPEVSEVLERCWKKDPDDRFQTALEVASALRRVQRVRVGQQAEEMPLWLREWAEVNWESWMTPTWRD